MTHSVLDKFGERLCEGTREYCEEMIRRMKWREVRITHYVKKPISNRKWIAKTNPERGRKFKSVYKQPIVAIFEDGHREVFETVEQVASRFNIVPKSVYAAIYRARQASVGKLKGVKLVYEKREELK